MSFCAVNNNLLSSVNSLNEMNPWNSWDCQLVNLDGIQKIISENLDTIRTTCDWRLCQSLTDLGKRVSEEPYFSSEAKVLAKFISSLIPVHDPDMPSFISLAPEDIRDNVMQHLDKSDLISFSQTSKQMYQASAKWKSIKTDEFLIDLFNLCMENISDYKLSSECESESRFEHCLTLKKGSGERIDALRHAFLPLFRDRPADVIKNLPACFYEDKLLILNLIVSANPKPRWRFDSSILDNKFELAYLELLKKGEIHAPILYLDAQSLIENKMVRIFAEIIRKNKVGIGVALLNIPKNFSKLEGLHEIRNAINEKKFSWSKIVSSDENKDCYSEFSAVAKYVFYKFIINRGGDHVFL